MTGPVACPSSQTSESDLLRETERARLRALVSADLDQAQRFHASDFQLITPIGVPLSKAEYLGAIAAGQIRYLAWEPGEIEVRLFDGVAALRYRAELEVVFGAQAVPPGAYWHTDLYEKRDGEWMVVWSQATAVR